MEKTISINIGGVVFHIEEDGYQKLKSYLNSIHRYFSTFADSNEILSDIEGRVAEKFLLKLKNDSKQAISAADVDELIATMGTVADFEAIENSEDFITDPLSAKSAPAPQNEPKRPEGPQTAFPNLEPRKPLSKFTRDLKRKLLGGVAAGLGHHYSIDPLWIRLLMLFLAFGATPIAGATDGNPEFFAMLSGVVIVVYIVIWITFPGSYTLEEDKRVKKFYRDPDKKVIGGVAAGLASYFGVEISVVRFVWVLSIFLFGTGLLAYLVLWIIAPAANTLTEKMEMQGEPITLSNIETNLKKGLDLDTQPGQESVVTKILLLPFRAISLVIHALGKLLTGLGPIVRVLIGAFLVFMSSVVLFSILVAASVFFGLSNAPIFSGSDIPLSVIRQVPPPLIISSVIASSVPFLFLLFIGLNLLANRRIVGPTVWFSALGIWIVGVIAAAISGISFAGNFAREGYVDQVSYYAVPRNTLTLTTQDVDNDWEMDVNVALHGTENRDSLKLEKHLRARGRSTKEAREFAETIDYKVVLSDSVLRFDDYLILEEDVAFRAQRINIDLGIPYDLPFAMTRDFYYQRLDRYEDNTRELEKYKLRDSGLDWSKLRWVIKREEGLVCINLPAEYYEINVRDDRDHEYEWNDGEDEIRLGDRGNYVKEFSTEKFDKVKLGGAFATQIRYGTEQSVTLDGDEEDINRLVVRVKDNTLLVEPKESNWFNNQSNRIGLIVTIPQINDVELSGANKAVISGFDNLNELKVKLSGASKAALDVKANSVKADLSGASSLHLRGGIQDLLGNLSGVCRIIGNQAEIKNVDITADGASKAVFGRVNNIKKSLSGASKVESVQE